MLTMRRGRGAQAWCCVCGVCLLSVFGWGTCDAQKDAPKYSGEGYLRGWLVIGPFPEQGRQSAEMIDVARGDDADDVEYGGRNYSWQPAKRGANPYRIDFALQFGSSDPGVAYATTEVYVNRDMIGELRIHSDEQCAVWVNGERRALRDSAKKGPDSCRTRLRFGFNRIVVRVPQKKGPWDLRVQLLTEGSEPIAPKYFWLMQDPLYLQNMPTKSESKLHRPIDPPGVLKDAP